VTSAEDLEAQVLRYVREHDYVTFAALHKHFAADAREQTEIALPGNRVVWAGMPKPLVDAILALLEAEALAAIPGHPSAYRRDGRVLALPVEKVLASAPHTEPHWFPVLLRPMETVLAEAE